MTEKEAIEIYNSGVGTLTKIQRVKKLYNAMKKDFNKEKREMIFQIHEEKKRLIREVTEIVNG